MAYSDKDMQIAAQISYLDFDKTVMDSGGPYTLRELFSMEAISSTDGGYLEHWTNELMNATDEVSRAQAQGKLDLYNTIMDPNSEYGNWVLKDVMDDNSNSGMYACMLETGDKEAVIGFRGSESTEGQLKRDWVDADLGLLNSEITLQQKVASDYMNQLYSKYGNEYDNFALSGHSLGGNLATHAAIDASDGMKAKITQVTSFDGPGFSDEYLASHKDDIAKINDRLTHYQWSPVGVLLTQPAGIRDHCIEIEDAPEGEELRYFLLRHDTCFIRFDENGNIIPTEPYQYDSVIGDISRFIDSLNNFELGLIVVAGVVVGLTIIISYPELIAAIGVVLVVTKVASIIQDLFKKAKEWIESLFGPSVEYADFSIQPDVLRNVASEEARIANELRTLSGEIEQVKSRISGVSLEAVKWSVGHLADKVEDYQGKMNKMSDVIGNAVTQYQMAEIRIKDQIATVIPVQ